MAWDEEKAEQKAIEALGELKNLPKEEVKKVYDWWNKYYMTTGHKKLFRAMREYVG